MKKAFSAEDVRLALDRVLYHTKKNMESQRKLFKDGEEHQTEKHNNFGGMLWVKFNYI